jgi:hypothetical protein
VITHVLIFTFARVLPGRQCCLQRLRWQKCVFLMGYSAECNEANAGSVKQPRPRGVRRNCRRATVWDGPDSGLTPALPLLRCDAFKHS